MENNNIMDWKDKFFSEFITEGSHIEFLRKAAITVDPLTKKASINWNAVPLGKNPDAYLGFILRVPTEEVARQRMQRRIPEWSGAHVSIEGNQVYSLVEQIFDAYLHCKKIPHQHETEIKHGTLMSPTLGRIPADIFPADFYLPQKDLYVEVTGMQNDPNYRKRMEIKKEIYRLTGKKVKWLTANEVREFWNQCPRDLKFDNDTIPCKNCGKQTIRKTLNGKGICPQCARRMEVQQLIPKNDRPQSYSTGPEEIPNAPLVGPGTTETGNTPAPTTEPGQKRKFVPRIKPMV